MKRIITVLILILFSANILAMPQNEFWEKKDYRQWSERECHKLLFDSPWVKYFTLKYGRSEYRVQIRSATPIRQALLRQMQINDNYENLSTEQRREYDRRTDEYLSAPFNDTIIIFVAGPNPSYYWQAQTTEMLQNSTFLIPSKNKKIPLLKFEILSSGISYAEFQFIFPRQYEGRPVLSKDEKSLSLEFLYPESQAGQVTPDSRVERAFIEFKVDKMLFNGEIAY